jgi:hypothetical protein
VIQVKTKIISLLILILLLSTSLVFASDDIFDKYGVRKEVMQTLSEEDVVNLGSKDNVFIDKEWTVEFNQEIDLNEIFSMSIKKRNGYIPVDIAIVGETEAKIIPVNDYEYNTEYSVYISLFNGNQYKMDFKTIQQSNLNIRDFEYIKNPRSNEMIIIGYNGLDMNVNIPSIINGIPVTTIGSGAFKSLNIESVSIPNTITTIRKEAFEYNDLKSVEIPNSVTRIDEYAFRLNSIKTLDLPDSLKTITKRSFSGNNIQSVDLPDTLENIEDYAFSNNDLKIIELPDSLETIGNNAFRDNNLNFVEIPQGCSYNDEDNYDNSFDSDVNIIQK